jgi:F-type H+-transporting ATPase subunit delta
MAELATIARPYAQAVFRAAQTGSTGMAAWSAFLSEAGQVAAHRDVQALAHNPNVSSQQIASLLLAAVKSPASDEARNFVNMLAENDRITLLPEISAQFNDLKNDHEGAADAEIVSAFELSDTQRDELVTALERKFGRRLNPTVVIDPFLIGGVRVVVGDEVLDTSVRARLQQMHTALAA